MWDDKCEAAFIKLKGMLTSAPVLAVIDGSEGLTVYTNASQVGLGAVLMQHGRVIAYAGRQLKTHEVKYAVHDLELLAVVFALKLWRRHLLGTKFELFTDHKSLKYIFTQKDLNQRQVRWLEFLSSYDLDITYTPGKANVVADALSRRRMAMCNVVEATLYQLVATPTLIDRTVAKQYENDMLKRIKEKVLSMQRNIRDDWAAQIDRKGVLRINGRMCVPNVDGLRQEILRENHHSKLAIHPSVTKMYQNIKKAYWWSGMKRDNSIYVSRCATCQKVKADHQKTTG